jgi:hypothetical protein
MNFTTGTESTSAWSAAGLFLHRPVIPLQVRTKGVFADDDRLDVELGDELQVVDGREVGGIGHRHREHPTHPPQRQNQMFIRDVRGDESQYLVVDGDLVQRDRGHAVLLGEHPGQLFLGHEPELDQGIAQACTPRPGVGQGFLQLRPRDEPFANEEISETDFLGDLG